MFASIRRYRLREGSMDDLMRRVDGGFAEEISRRPGFCSYEALDCDDGEVVTISVFGEAGQAEASRELAQRWSDENLGDFRFTRLEALHGEILVSRAVQVGFAVTGRPEPGDTEAEAAVPDRPEGELVGREVVDGDECHVSKIGLMRQHP
jgi:hypothetical protein